jgi:hypothetical protein
VNLPRRWIARAGVLLWLVLAVPPVRHALQATMTLQMLAQIPLLVVAGWLASRATPRRVNAALASWNAQGVAGLLLASFTGAVWMLPRMMDASVDVPHVAIAKFITLPLLVGVPLGLSWPRMGFVVRGVFLLEAIATTFRLGWLYLISRQRLCSNYLLGDQQRLGRALIVIGVALSLFVIWKLMWGHVRIPDESDGA